MDMKPSDPDEGRIRAERDAAMREQMGSRAEHETDLQRQLLAFIEQESGMVKGLAAQGKKQLAREVVHLRALVKTVKLAIANVKPGAPTFGHAEAFRLMAYVQTNAVEGEEPETLMVWNSRDGVTPFIVHIGGRSYQHTVRGMEGPFYDLPRDRPVTHKWVTRTDAEVLAAWRRTLDRAVEQGKLEPDKAELQRDNLEAAESWNYRIGLVSLTSGRFTDEEALAHG